MKKYFKLFILLLLIFFVSACGSKKVEEPKIDDDTVILEGITYKLNQTDEEYGLKYKVASNFRKTELINAINYYSENINDRAYFVIRLFHYKNKSIDYAINDIAPEYDSKKEVKINDLDYTLIHFINYTKADVNIYLHQHNNDVYAITFTAGIDLSRLEDIFLKNVEYDSK